MTTPTQALHAACLAFERATGREIPLDDIVLERDVGYGIHWRLRVLDQAIRIPDSTAHDILEARAWRAVREWVQHTYGYAEWKPCGLVMAPADGCTEQSYPDLPTALLAVAAWVESQPK